MAVISKKARNGINVKGITLQVKDNVVTLTKGAIISTVNIHNGCNLDIQNDICYINNETNKMLAGTDYSNVNRAVMGLNKPYTQEMQIRGSGFKISIQPKHLIFSLGFSHQITVDIPTNITVVQDTTKKSTTKENILTIVLTSKDYQPLMQFVNKLTKFRKFNPYKGTGVIQMGKFMPRKKSSKGSGGKSGK